MTVPEFLTVSQRKESLIFWSKTEIVYVDNHLSEVGNAILP